MVILHLQSGRLVDTSNTSGKRGILRIHTYVCKQYIVSICKTFSIIKEIQEMVKLQKNNINLVDCCTITIVDYVNSAVENDEEEIKNKRLNLPTQIQTPMMSSYVP